MSFEAIDCYHMTKSHTRLSCVCIPCHHSYSITYNFCSTYRHGEPCDVQLVVNRMEIDAHKTILAAASQYLRAKFASPRFIEAGQDKVTICCDNSQAVQSLIEYAYTGRIQITRVNVQVTIKSFLVSPR